MQDPLYKTTYGKSGIHNTAYHKRKLFPYYVDILQNRKVSPEV